MFNDYEVKEINGVNYRVFKNGRRVKHQEDRFPNLPKHAGVYLITDRSTGLKYVGSSKNLHSRATNHFNPMKSNNAKFGLFGKLGIDQINIKIEMLADCQHLTANERLELEADFIVKLNTLKPNGLNSEMPKRMKDRYIAGARKTVILFVDKENNKHSTYSTIRTLLKLKCLDIPYQTILNSMSRKGFYEKKNFLIIRIEHNK